MKPSKYARLKHCVLRLDGDRYVRDAGGWSIEYRVDGEKIFAVGRGQLACADGVEFTPATEQEWREDNLGYV